MHPLAAASRSRMLETGPELIVFETSYYALSHQQKTCIMLIIMSKTWHFAASYMLVHNKEPGSKRLAMHMPFTARVPMTFIDGEGIVVVNWPTRSPHLNQIEHIWDILSRRIRQRPHHPENVQDISGHR